MPGTEDTEVNKTEKKNLTLIESNPYKRWKWAWRQKINKLSIQNVKQVVGVKTKHRRGLGSEGGSVRRGLQFRCGARWRRHWDGDFWIRTSGGEQWAMQLSGETSSTHTSEIPWRFSGENRQAVGNRGEDWLAGENRVRTAILEFICRQDRWSPKTKWYSWGKNDGNVCLKGWAWTQRMGENNSFTCR